MTKIEIRLNGAGCGSVKLDGEEMPRVRTIELATEAGAATYVSLGIIAPEVDIVAENAEVEIAEINADQD